MIKDHKRMDLSVELLDPNPHNPNEMSPRQFNLLVDNLDKVGFTDPILVRKVGKRYRVVGGHHRLDAAKLLGHLVVPCTVIDDPEFDDDTERFQLMRHNMIRGKLSTSKFVALYETLSTKYSAEILAESFGFEEQAQLERLIATTLKGLPPEVKEKFKEGVKEVKTIKDLGVLLNKLFTTYGDTIPYGYMFMDFGGKDSVWLRMHTSDLSNFSVLAELAQARSVSLDGMFRVLMQLAATDKLPWITDVLDSLPKVKLPPGKMPIEDNLDAVLGS